MLLSNGELYSFGEGSYSELGLGKPYYRLLTPTRVEGNWKNLRKISAGFMHTLALNDQGEFYSWGSGRFGVLGSGDQANIVSPETINVGMPEISSLSDMVYRSSPVAHSLTKEVEPVQKKPELGFLDIAAGKYHSLFVQKGAAYSCG